MLWFCFCVLALSVTSWEANVLVCELLMAARADSCSDWMLATLLFTAAISVLMLSTCSKKASMVDRSIRGGDFRSLGWSPGVFSYEGRYLEAPIAFSELVMSKPAGIRLGPNTSSSALLCNRNYGESSLFNGWEDDIPYICLLWVGVFDLSYRRNERASATYSSALLFVRYLAVSF